MKTADLYVKGGALFSKCRIWRYSLWRELDLALLSLDWPVVNFICLNPSTADENTEDPTVRRCIRWARSWNAKMVVVTNLFAYRATNPKDMLQASDPVGPRNDHYILKIAPVSHLVIAAWGVHGEHLDRGRQVAKMLRDAGVVLHCMGTTKGGHPRHPLYLRNDVRPVVFDPKVLT